MKVGIDSLAVYTSRYALDLAILAKARSVEANKYHVGLGQYKMSVSPPGEDVVTMAANAAMPVLKDIRLEDIDLLLFATESGIDQSKAAGIYVHHLLKLPPRCRVVELKQACYSGTAALQLAIPYLRQYPQKKALLIASDIARYGLGSTGESSQGSGAVAMILSANPRLLASESDFGVVTDNVMDFWRPNYADEAIVEGKYSSKLYLPMLEKTWEQYRQLSGRQLKDHARFCYHVPVPRLVEKAHQTLLRINQQEAQAGDAMTAGLQATLHYGRLIGNSYTAALYVGLASLLDTDAADLSGERIGFYSYGSGCVAEFFSGIVQPGYQEALQTAFHRTLFETREMLDYSTYESFYQYAYPVDGREHSVPYYQTGGFRLVKLQQHQRIYEALNEGI